jgi:hypothetical protein
LGEFSPNLVTLALEKVTEMGKNRIKKFGMQKFHGQAEKGMCSEFQADILQSLASNYEKVFF